MKMGNPVIITRKTNVTEALIISVLVWNERFYMPIKVLMQNFK